MKTRSPRIGISLSFMYPDQQRPLFRGKTLQYFEERLILSVARSGAIPIPLVDLKTAVGAELVLDGIDGVLFSGGADISPQHYGEEPLEPRWQGDAVRDAYELRLVKAARQLHLPMLGICRGAQLLNVALGGTMYQDINTQVADTLLHRCPDRYDQQEHPVVLKSDSWLSSLYPEPEILVNTVHHQAVKNLAPGLMATAHAPDGVLESFERVTEMEWIVGIQWHPEWLDGQPDTLHRADGDRIFTAFTQICVERILTLAR